MDGSVATTVLPVVKVVLKGMNAFPWVSCTASVTTKV
jgi:hypothetical protein